MALLAAIDIGSNSVRLKIARLARHRLVTVYEDREVTRLGKSVFAAGMLTPAAMARTVATLQRFHKAIQKHGAQVVRVVATSALRDARNGRVFVEWVRSATGWEVEVITGLEEARLIHLGLVANLRLGSRPVLMVDLGGGSCELTISVAGHIRYTSSLPLGAVRLTEDFLQHEPPTNKELRRMQAFILKELQRVKRRIARFRPRIAIATSGTAAALAAMGTATPPKKHGSLGVEVRRSKVSKAAKKLARLKPAQRTAIPGIGPRRAEIIVAGAFTFSELLSEFRLAAFRYSNLGLRDGLLAQMASDFDRSARSRRQITSERWDAVLNAIKSYRADGKYSARVRALALDLFKKLAPIHELPPAYGEWLSVAAMLHEVGMYVNRYGWHRHTNYVIANSEMFGYTSYERLVIAAIARYLGNSRPSPNDKAMRALLPADRLLVPKASLLLRMARALNQSRRGIVRGVSAQMRGSQVRLRLNSAPRARADLEQWALAKEAAYFRELFGRELETAAS